LGYDVMGMLAVRRTVPAVMKLPVNVAWDGAGIGMVGIM
jgi:hypothetical protein